MVVGRLVEGEGVEEEEEEEAAAPAPAGVETASMGIGRLKLKPYCCHWCQCSLTAAVSYGNCRGRAHGSHRPIENGRHSNVEHELSL